jgi:hypothetical protein
MAERVRERARKADRTAAWKCYGLTTADRPDRQAHIDDELQRSALPFEVFVSERPADPGGFASIGFRGCFDSHLRALRAARDEGVGVAVLVEDDVVIASRFLELLPELQRELADQTWSIVLLGYLGEQSPARHFPLEPVSAHLARAQHWEFTGSHFVEQRLRPGGHRISVDGVYNEFRLARGHDTLVCVPNLARQAPSPSGTATSAGLRARALALPALRRGLLSCKRAAWDVAAMLPPSVSLRAWNLRAELTAAQRARYVDGTPATR